MIGFIGTSLRLHSTVTAHTSNSSWTSVWRISPKNHSLTSDCLERSLSDKCSEERERVRVTYDWRFTANQFVLETNPLKPNTRFFFFQLNIWGYSLHVTSSRTKWVCRLQLLLVLASAVILRSEYRGTHDHILLSQIRDSTHLEGQVPIFISPRNRVAWLYPQALDSIFVASYDSRGDGGGIRPRLQTG
jgi:hypothetical protein